MNENSMSGWAGLAGSDPYSADNANIMQTQGIGNSIAGGPQYSAPPLGAMNYGGSVSPSTLNGYPMFSSSIAGQSSPSGYANANPLSAPQNMSAPMAQAPMPPNPVVNPSAPTPATMNPWNVRTSSQGTAFDYPMGQPSNPPKLNVL